jgi:hypothetical protein
MKLALTLALTDQGAAFGRRFFWPNEFIARYFNLH